MDPLPFRTLVYRYFFFGWLLRDVRAGDVFARSAAVRHNRMQARWLPAYMRRWLVWSLLFYGLGRLEQMLFDEPVLGLWLYTASAAGLVFGVTAVCAWFGLSQRHQPTEPH